MSIEHRADKNYPFDNITLANPRSMQGGAYFSKILFSKGRLVMQTPRCKSKNGIHISGKRVYCDLLFMNENEDFILWVQDLEEKLKDLIYEKREIWFHNDPDREEIDFNWNDSIRTYKRNNFLLRTVVDKDKINSVNEFSIWDEEQNQLSLNEVTSNSELVNIIEVAGIKFTAQSFNLIIKLRQVMVVKPENYFNNCLIKLNKKPKLQKKILQDEVVSEANKNEDEVVSEANKNEVEGADVSKASEVKVADVTKASEVKVADVSKASEVKVADVSKASEVDGADKDVSKASEVEGEVDVEKIDLNQKKTIENEVKSEIEEMKMNNLDKIDTLTKNNQAKIIQSAFRKFLGDNKNTSNKKSAKESSNLEKNVINGLTEIDIGHLDFDTKEDAVQLKNPREVYINIYKEAREKAKQAKKRAIEAYLEAKRIKQIYFLDEIDSSDSESEVCNDIGEGLILGKQL